MEIEDMAGILEVCLGPAFTDWVVGFLNLMEDGLFLRGGEIEVTIEFGESVFHPWAFFFSSVFWD